MRISARHISAAVLSQTLRFVARSKQIKVMWGPRHFLWSHVFASPALALRLWWIRWGAFWRDSMTSSGCADDGSRTTIHRFDCYETEPLRSAWACARENWGPSVSWCIARCHWETHLPHCCLWAALWPNIPTAQVCIRPDITLSCGCIHLG